VVQLTEVRIRRLNVTGLQVVFERSKGRVVKPTGIWVQQRTEGVGIDYSLDGEQFDFGGAEKVEINPGDMRDQRL
jgi:hypothetical protein